MGFRLHVLIEIRRRHTIKAMRGLLLWPLLAIHALAWKHVSEDALRTSLKESEYTMIACESNSSLKTAVECLRLTQNTVVLVCTHP